MEGELMHGRRERHLDALLPSAPNPSEPLPEDRRADLRPLRGHRSADVDAANIVGRQGCVKRLSSPRLLSRERVDSLQLAYLGPTGLLPGRKAIRSGPPDALTSRETSPFEAR